MSDVLGNGGGGGGGSAASASPHILAALQHDKLTLQRRLAEVQVENRALRFQLYQVTALLDVAVSQLGSRGVSFEAPVDVRAMRAEVQRYMAAATDATVASATTTAVTAAVVGVKPAAVDGTTVGHATVSNHSLAGAVAAASGAGAAATAASNAAPLAAADDGTPLTAPTTTSGGSSSSSNIAVAVEHADAKTEVAGMRATTAAAPAAAGSSSIVNNVSVVSTGSSSNNNNSIATAMVPLSATRGTTTSNAAAAGKLGSNNSSSTLTAAVGTAAAATSSSLSSSSLFHLRAHLREHTRAVQSCAFAPGDDALLATCALDGRVVVQNFFTATRTWDVQAHDENVSDVAWFDATSQLLSASYDGTVKLWDYRRAERTNTTTTSSSNNNCSSSSSTGGGGGGGSSNAASTAAAATPLYTYVAHGFVLAATPVDAAAVFACADSRRYTALVDVRAPRAVAWTHGSRVNTLAYDAHTSQLLMGHADGMVTLWDVRHVGSAVASCATAASHSHHANSNGSSSSSSSSKAAMMTATTAHVDAAAAASEATAMAASTPVRCVYRMLNEPSRASIAHVAQYSASDESTRLLCASHDGVVRVYRGRLHMHNTTMPATSATAGADAVVVVNNNSNTNTGHVGSNASNTNNDVAAMTSARSSSSSSSSAATAAAVIDNNNNNNSSNAECYRLHNVLLDAAARGFRVRSGFWKGRREAKNDTSIFFDDVDKDADAHTPPPPRRLLECDLVVTAGREHTAVVYDVTDQGSAATLSSSSSSSSSSAASAAGAVVLDRLHGHRDRVTGAFVHPSDRRLIIATTSADATVRVWVPAKS